MVLNDEQEKILNEACRRYSIKRDGIRLIRSYRNLIFDCNDKILRLTSTHVNTIEVEMDWINYLALKGLSVVRVVKSINNRVFEQIGGSDFAIAICFKKIVGERITRLNWNELHFRKLGEITGRLHKLSSEYTEKKQLVYNHWYEIEKYNNFSFLDNEYLTIHQELVNEFHSYSRVKEIYGLVHYDIHHGNYLISGKSNDLVLFDFELTCKSWYINDIAIVLYYAKQFKSSRNDKTFEERFLDSFWIGYENNFSIDNLEKQKIPKFLLYRDLFVLGYVNRVWDKRNLTKRQKKYIDLVEESIFRTRMKLAM